MTLPSAPDPRALDSQGRGFAGVLLFVGQAYDVTLWGWLDL
jgi:hypothetical protein